MYIHNSCSYRCVQDASSTAGATTGPAAATAACAGTAAAAAATTAATVLVHYVLHYVPSLQLHLTTVYQRYSVTLLATLHRAVLTTYSQLAQTCSQSSSFSYTSTQSTVISLSNSRCTLYISLNACYFLHSIALTRLIYCYQSSALQVC
jgi:hypothetical protein